MKTTNRIGLAALTVVMMSAPAQAHHVAQASGFAAGLAHPLLGWDHVLAMACIGVWSRQQALGLRAPLLFLLAMAAGALLQLGLPALETGLAAGVALIGVLVACAVRMPAAAALSLVALFGFLHGQAHGLELAGTASMVGFLLSSAALLAAGRAIRAGRLAGSFTGVAGLCLLVGVG